MTKKIKPKIILISGKKQSGKNLTASLIEELSENPNNSESCEQAIKRYLESEVEE